jgi:carbon-monoxide dehydrogenase medium subunit
VIPHHVEYEMPRSVEEAVTRLAEDPEGTQILAGGTWVVPELNRGVARPRRVIDLRRAGLAEISLDGETVKLGAMATYAGVLASPVLAEHVPLLALMAAGVTGGVQLTGQATLGGSAAAARPHSDAPAALVASAAVAVLAGAGGERRLEASALFTGAMRTAIEPGELLTGFEIPTRAGARVGYYKLKRGGSSWPIATAAVVMSDGAGGLSAVLGGVAAVPLTIALDPILDGAPLTPELIEAAGERAGAAVREPWSDVLASGAYRARVAGPVLKRALSQVMRDG